MTGKRCRVAVWMVMACLGAGVVRGQTIYVAAHGSHDSGNNFDTWGGAATNIHDAVDLANALGRDVVVSNGTYYTTDTLMITNAFTIQSLNGPDVTIIERSASAPDFWVVEVHGGSLVAGLTIRGGKTGSGWQYAAVPTGVVVTNGAAVVSNCVIRANIDGAGVRIWQDGLVTHSRIVSNTTYNAVRVENGGILQDSVVAYQSNRTWPGVNIQAGGLVRRCRIHDNSSNGWGPGGVLFQGAGRLENSLVYANYSSAHSSHHAAVNLTANGIVENCVIFGNTGTSINGGAGLVRTTSGTVRNTIIFGNINTAGASNPDYHGAADAVFHSCSPDFTAGFQGNIADDPMFVDSAARDFRLRPGSPCIDAGTDQVSVTDDIDGNPRPQIGGTRGGNDYDMGAYELDGTSGDFAVGFYGSLPRSGFEPLEVTFHANAIGTARDVIWWGWDFNADGNYEWSGAGLATVTTNFDAGLHSVVVTASNSFGAVATSTNLNYITVVGTNLYVATNGLHVYPFADWDHAATNIHDAVEAAVGGCTIHVGAGVFKTVREIEILDAIAILGSGRESTVLERDAAAGNFRLMNVNHPDAFIAGFMLKNGHAGTAWATLHGLNLLGGVASNITITACSSTHAGRSLWVANALLTHSVVTNNSGDSAYLHANGIIRDSLLAFNGLPNSTTRPAVELAQAGARVERCRILGNRGQGYNGAAPPAVQVSNGILRNSLIAGNYATGAEPAHAAGVRIAGGIMENCTIAANVNAVTATLGSGVHQTGGTIRNCIVSGNRGSSSGEYTATGGTIVYSLAPQLTQGINGNIAGAAMFADVDYRLLPGSPGIDAGTNIVEVTVDLDGNPRPQIGGTRGGNDYDMGAYELDGTSGDFAVGFYGSLPRSGFAPHAVTFYANAVGSNTTVTWYGWDFNNNGNYELTGAGLGTVTNAFGPGVYSVRLAVSNSLGNVAMSSNLNYVSVTGENLYVATNGLHVFPFADWDHAATNIHAAVAVAIAGSTVHVGSGVFMATNTLFVNGFDLIGVNGPDETELVLDSSGVSSLYPVLYVDDLAGESRVVGVTVRGGKAGGTGWQQGGNVTGIRLWGGVVSNCVVRSNGPGGTIVDIRNPTALMTHSRIVENTNYIGVSISGDATLQDSEIAYNNGSTGPYHLFMQSGAVVRHCRIHHNSVSPPWEGAWNNIRDAGTRLENTLVYANYSARTYHPAGLRIAGGEMVNCTIAGNTNAASSTMGAGIHQIGGSIVNTVIHGNVSASGDYTTTGGTIVYSLAPELTPGENGNLNADPLFADADYRLAAESPAVGTGIYQDWMDGALDLDGNPRGRPGRVDMGCYQRMPPRGSLFLLK